VPAESRAPDSRGERAAELGRRSLGEPLAFLELNEVFTAPLRGSDRFRDAFAQASSDLAACGPMEAIERAIA